MRESWQPRDWRTVLNYSWHLGHPFGVELRLHWMVFLMPLLLWIAIGNLAYALVFTALLYLVVYTHEMGHIAAGWRYRIPSTMIMLSPLGGVAHMQAPAPHRTGDIIISLAGPATHLPWIALSWGLTQLLPVGSYGTFVASGFLQLNFWLLGFNLLPFYPLDGGRVFTALLSFKLPDWRARLIGIRVGQVGAVLMILSGFFPVPIFGRSGGGILFAIGISGLLACNQALQMLKHGGLMYEKREPWQMDSDAWKRGKSGFGDDGQRGPRLRDGRRERKDREAHNRRLQEQEELEKELDRILEKVHKEGMTSLTKKERKTLQKASEQRRDS